MHIASKYHEVQNAVIDDYVYITDNAYTRDEIRAKEVEILTEIEFDLNQPSARLFLDRLIVTQDLQGSRQCTFLAYYLLELVMLSADSLKYRPSQ
jgi:hypothetical protein